VSRAIGDVQLMALTLQNTHDTHEDTIVQNVLINGMVIEKHLGGMTTVSHVKHTWGEKLTDGLHASAQGVEIVQALKILGFSEHFYQRDDVALNQDDFSSTSMMK
jgi:hypothetical protein